MAFALGSVNHMLPSGPLARSPGWGRRGNPEDSPANRESADVPAVLGEPDVPVGADSQVSGSAGCRELRSRPAGNVETANLMICRTPEPHIAVWPRRDA